ncbi:thymidylate synthase [Bacillus cytotoxicus]|uniref:Thymidylate synthase n=1 Tax=Bacillus cytotoxicus TaxID=580165 RepID=A0ACC6A9B3_9BACI|nr:thymidylate synthase [Bacillus cytotoxicus]
MSISSTVEKDMNIITGEQCLSYINIYGENVDELVKQSIHHIFEHGERIQVRAGKALQSYGVNYILTNPRNRLHCLRTGAIKYLCRELLAYFNGSLKASDGLAQASKFWMTLVDEDGKINSNYGYYVFHEKVSGTENQYGWAIKRLLDNPDSRRAIININQNYHKSDTKDFPCTVAMQFFIKNNYLHCEVMSRSTDVITGLPYDMGFFSFIHELVFQDLVEQKYTNLKLGNTVMKTSFTQIYDKTQSKALEVSEGLSSNNIEMPRIDNVKNVLNDIYIGTENSEIIKWIKKEAKLDK